MINLNDTEFDVKVSKIFNNGKAGIVRNVKASRIERKPEGTNNPDYRIIFTDLEGRESNIGFYHSTDEENGKKLGKRCKDLLITYMPSNYTIPEFADYKDMLDKTMHLISTNLNSVMVRVATNYGTTMKPKAFLNIRNYSPWIEAESKPFDDTKLSPQNIEVLERPNPDNNDSTTNTTFSNDVI